MAILKLGFKALKEYRMNTYKYLCIIFYVSFLFSCKILSNDPVQYERIECPEEICNKVFDFAVCYKDSDTEYVWGGQDPLRTIRIDCSGLVVRCYQYAVNETEYQLLFQDASSAAMYEKYSAKTFNPRKGDLIFMGEENSPAITHIAIFDRFENGKVYFIDSTMKDTDGDGFDDINGVSERSYAQDDKKIKSYGIMLLGKIK